MLIGCFVLFCLLPSLETKQIQSHIPSVPKEDKNLVHPLLIHHLSQYTILAPLYVHMDSHTQTHSHTLLHEASFGSSSTHLKFIAHKQKPLMATKNAGGVFKSNLEALWCRKYYCFHNVKYPIEMKWSYLAQALYKIYQIINYLMAQYISNLYNMLLLTHK